MFEVMFEDDLKQWERRHPGSISHFLSTSNLLHYESNCAGTYPQWVPGDVVQELWRLGRNQLRFIGWCERCAVKRKGGDKHVATAAREADGASASGDRDGEEPAQVDG